MKLLALDLSTKTGAAVLQEGEDGGVAVARRERIALEKAAHEFGPYPENLLRATEVIAAQVCAFVEEENPDKIVIEETNLGKNRYSQKILEFIHRAVLERLRLAGLLDRVYYVSSSEWRKALAIKLNSAQRAQNTILSRAKRRAAEKGVKLDKKALGVTGKVTQKHIALAYVNERFPELELKMKDNDIADAIALGCAYLAGAKLCDGT